MTAIDVCQAVVRSDKEETSCELLLQLYECCITLGSAPLTYSFSLEYIQGAASN